MDNIARQAAQAERKAPAEIEQTSNKGANGAKNQKGPSEFAEWVHEASLKLASFEVKASDRILTRSDQIVSRQLRSVRGRRRSS
jgi:hypothetical protein